jgi:cytochrome c oxidase subunit 1
VTIAAPKSIVTRPYPVRQPVMGSALGRLIRTTDAKQIGLLYLITSFGFFIAGGLIALPMLAELVRPGLQFLSLAQYNQLFTMHGTIMLLLFATPILFAFANYIVSLQIGAPDVALPRLNAWPTGCICSAAPWRSLASRRPRARRTTVGSPISRWRTR